jgi:prefoldin beta subunit
MVLREMGFIEEGDTVYKSIGPILVKQELDEAKMNLEKRVNFIQEEM